MKVTLKIWRQADAASHASGEDRPGGYYVAHSVLIVVDLAIGVVLGLIGLKALRKPAK